MKRIKEIWSAVLVLSIMAAVLIFPMDAADGIERGLELCLSRIIPSIFPMMVVSILIVECGYAQRVGRLLGPVSRFMFGLPGEAGAAVMLSMVGGYPAGAKAVMELYERGAVNKDEARKMAMFCFCAGPAFLIGVVGGLAGSAALGWILMGVQLVAVTATGVLVCGIKRKNMADKVEDRSSSKAQSSFSDAVVSSVGKSAQAMLQVCLYVIVFSAVNGLVQRVGLSGGIISILTAAGMRETAAKAVIPVLLEVTGGCVSAINAGLPMVAFAVGFGGLSVQMQVLAIIDPLGVNRGIFMLTRLFQGGLSAALTAIVLELLPEGSVISASAQLSDAKLSGSPQGALMLLVMCSMYVLCLPEKDAAIGGRKAV